MDRPLISFIVATYNQEAFVREAVEGALAQTYSPLEIIISDDCSRDRTVEVAQQVIANYKGPHQVRINRNPTNLGIGGHVNRLMEICKGELIVTSAGDDISLPERTETIFQAWEASGRRATSIFSSYMTISATGEELGLGGTRGDPADPTLYRPQRGDLFNFLEKIWPVVVGCTHAWSPKLFDFFGPLIGDLEDQELSFRTLAIGELLYVHRPLIKYRRHGDNVSFFAGWDDTQSFEHREKRLRWTDEKSTGAFANIVRDIETLCSKGRITAAERDRLKTEAERVAMHFTLERDMMDGGICERVGKLIKAARNGHVRCAVRMLPRALPRPIYRELFFLREKWRKLTRTSRRR